jgi:hypothetical protein
VFLTFWGEEKRCTGWDFSRLFKSSSAAA